MIDILFILIIAYYVILFMKLFTGEEEDAIYFTKFRNKRTFFLSLIPGYLWFWHIKERVNKLGE